MTNPFKRISPKMALQRAQQAVNLQERPGAVRATLTMPGGKQLQCVVRCGSVDELGAELEALAGGLAGDDDELAGFFKKLKKGLKKAVVTPVKLAHKYTHQVGPIAKMHKQVQDGVAKALPFTKPFIKVHNSLAAPVHKAIEGKKIKTKLTAKAIADVTKNLPPAQKGAAQAALVAKVKESDALKNIAKRAAKATVLAQAKSAAKRGDSEAKSFLKNMKRGTTGTFKVTTPSGRVINVPASKVV